MKFRHTLWAFFLVVFSLGFSGIAAAVPAPEADVGLNEAKIQPVKSLEEVSREKAQDGIERAKEATEQASEVPEGALS